MILKREINGKAEILLQLRQNTGVWDGYWDLSASGHVENGESLKQAAVRELKEELDINVYEGDLEFVHVSHNKIQEVYYTFYFNIKAYSGKIKVNEPEKCAWLRWFDAQSLPKNIIFIRKIALENYNKNIIYDEIGWNVSVK